MNGRTLLAIAFVGLAAAAGGLLLARPPAKPEPASLAAAQVADAKAAAPAGVPAPQAAPAPKADEAFTIKRILPIEGAIKYGDWHWDDAGVPDGPIVITVDLDARVLSIFKGGYEIGAAAVLLGTQDKPTPTGVFPIMEKQRHHVSNLYDAEMPYMQRLTNDGITLHASQVEWGYASHGCIAMPEPFAAKVFAQTKVGDRVFITRGKMVGMGDSLVDS
ncbi:L,D-transpeptidase family protein [Novosphingobium album (ex Liu et al. 2023)]|uniref:L,D-transpeptidase family protein n=1 Tax=Novosphingobium album (ex Liu et al. 2023) TaxID=3031130 RepID=A0ABT5WJF9_9SPHN|nr:L,D-transpeptidase family protein [Novosphingobium album (ex Liu et al. 2023)]MDE8650176.1 L,D-transpeptidase family protein [Novosphingobium album (ex Liu et al. 2023)]